MPEIARLSVPPQAPKRNWCWACVTAGVTNVYEASQLTRNDVARHFLGPGFATDDSVQFLERVLEDQRVLADDPITHAAGETASSAFDQVIRPQIDAGRPVCAEVRWWNRVHYVAISGYSVGPDGSVLLSIQDPEDPAPAFPPRKVPLEEFRHGYRQGMGWRVSFLTRRG